MGGDGQLDLLCDDLEGEHRSLDALVGDLHEDDWDLPTPAVGWSIRDQIHHLAFFDDRGVLAVRHPDQFLAWQSQLLQAADAAGEFAREQHAAARSHSGSALLERWRAERRRLLETFRSLDPATRVPWVATPMAAASFVTARLMETWAHGEDVADALGVERVPTARLRHVARLGWRALPYSFAVNGLAPPEQPVHVDLVAPDGASWQFGPPDAEDRVAGPALDFCLVVTQRRNLADTALLVTGERAAAWMKIAQAFAGPAGPGRPPRG